MLLACIGGLACKFVWFCDCITYKAQILFNLLCRANMDVLVSLGTNASYTYSLISILHHHFSGHHETQEYQPTDFFETSAMLITFILMGKYLEAKAKGRTSDAITALLTLAPPTAILLTVDDKGSVIQEEEIPTSLIHSDDLLKVRSDPKS